jgi:uncharacterized damage-inducible protein DinB
MSDDRDRFPVGRVEMPAAFTPALRARYISEIEEAPAKLRSAVAGLTDAQLDTPYRDQGWTVRQVVHHVPDSHLNAYVRVKLALTEDEPTIKPYNEARWSELEDGRRAPVEMSLALLDAIHRRWVACLRGISPDGFARTFRHPERGVMSIDQLLALYAWHGTHHVAHITRLRGRMGW